MAIAVGDPDLGVYSRYKSFADVTKEADATRLATQVAQIDNASKANVYKTQVLSAAAGSGDPLVYQGALQHLSENGIDVSDIPPDLATGSKYLEQARLAQSPLGTLFGAQQKIIGNNQAAITALGGVDQAKAAGQYQNVPNLTQFGIPSVSGVNAMPAGQAASMPMTQPADQGSIPIPVKAIDGPDPAVNISPTRTSGTLIQTPQGNPQALADMPAAQAAAIPVQRVGETPAAYKTRLESDPATVGILESAKTKGAGLGKDAADANKGAIASNEGYNQVVQTIDSIIKMAPDLPQKENMVGPETRAAYNQNFGDGKVAADYSKFKTINEAQTINTIRELADTGQIRMTRTLENIINRGYLVDPNLNAQGKIDQANAIKAELRNAAVSSNNVGVTYNGGPKADYSSPLSVPSNSVIGPATQSPQGNIAPEGTVITNGNQTLIKKNGQWAIQ